MIKASSFSTNGALPTRKVVHCVRQDGSAQSYYVYVPSAGGAGAPLLVVVHGISRNAEAHANAFPELCERVGAVMAVPVFGVDARDYQRLGRSGRGPRADAALDAVVEEVAMKTGCRASSFHLFGFSGGAQFAHRYTLAHPHRVTRLVAVGSGWYTFPDPRARFPYGIRRSPELPGVRFDPEEFLRVPITVMVGDRDTETKSLRDTPRVNRQQGRTRVERAERWVAAMREAAQKRGLEPLVTLETIPDGHHDFASLVKSGSLGERAFARLFDAPARAALGSSPNGG
ncbi:MAG: alpha/beta hydrolase [Candidatus Eisenbacteria bacterium]